MSSYKKSLNTQILEILKRHSDENHRLTREQILEYLRKEYDQEIDGRTVNNNIDSLLEDDNNDINFAENEVVSKVKGKTKKIIKRTDYYINRKFTESELRLIIDSIQCSKYIPETQCNQLIEKLLDEASEHFQYKKSTLKKYTSGLKMNPDLFTSIEVIGEAMTEKTKIEFNYYDYNIDKELIPRVDKEGNIRTYTLTPLRMVVNSGRYYLFGVPDVHNDISIYRVDKIKNAKKLDEPGKKKEDIKGLKEGLDLGKHISEHIFMNIGPSDVIIFEFGSWWISLVIDWFGKDILITKKDENTCIGSVKANLQSFENWAMLCSFAEVKVTSPKSLADSIKKRAKEISKLYK